MFSDSLSSKLALLNPSKQKEIESWIVNSVKVKMIRKLDVMLEQEGRVNARKLFLVPIFSINELTRRVTEKAPEMKTFFYRELVDSIEEVEKRITT